MGLLSKDEKQKTIADVSQVSESAVNKVDKFQSKIPSGA